MPRYHRIWDAKLGKAVRKRFTAAEESARDAEEASELVKVAAQRDRDATKQELENKLALDIITYDELKQLFRLERGL